MRSLPSWIWLTNEQLGFGVVIAGASCEMDIHDRRLAWILAANFAAQMISCFIWGELADLYGRRRVIWMASIVSIMFSLISASMPEFWSFLAVRTVCGFFIVASVVSLSTYLSEFTKVSLRPRVLTIMGYALGISMIYVPSLAGALLSLEMKPSGWRILLLCNQLPGIIGIVLLTFLPESPKYYLSMDNQEKAMKVMERVCRMNKGKDVTLKSLGVESLTQARLRPPNEGRELCHDTKVLLVKYGKVMWFFFFIFFTLTGLGFALPIWMMRIRVLTATFGDRNPICEHMDGISAHPSGDKNCHLTYAQMKDPLIHGCVVLCLFIVTSVFLIWLSRRAVIIAFVCVSILGCVALNFMEHPTLILISFFAIIDPLICSVRLAGSLLIDFIPTHLRGKAFALITMVGRSGVLIASVYVGYTLSHSCYVTFNTFIVVLIVCGMLVYWLPTNFQHSSFSN
ncbi:putative transporter SVOPL isoform X2 [Drosophila teissieri]|uniref:putative transporter SVOPL isoform X2 n=1 Tax=Drosophila teissieri TaxID=7243 RepID=UPI001CBA345B|nr:putative transporter SVOPL isoform X2 [Drosophila teissieri]